jgi:UDP-2,3-diacylglucosamine hydrolase
MTTLFISDLHLDGSRPRIVESFIEFVRDEARHANALYILGDLFEAWIGDDAVDGTARVVAEALAELQRSGVPCFFMHGNRDFLVGDGYARRARLTLLPDPAVIDIEGERTLVMHGDGLCLDDLPYQAFRRQSRDPRWQREFLSRPLGERREFAARARAESARYTRSVEEPITDVNGGAVAVAMRTHAVQRLIHGHTHRPAIHALDIDGQAAERIVLGDWYEQGSVLRIEPGTRELGGLAH